MDEGIAGVGTGERQGCDTSARRRSVGPRIPRDGPDDGEPQSTRSPTLRLSLGVEDPKGERGERA